MVRYEKWRESFFFFFFFWAHASYSHPSRPLPPRSPVIALSEDHKPDRRDERARIEAAGGAVVWAGAWRVGGVLAVSRAFGDRALKPYVSADPDVRDEMLQPEDAALVLASDGLWDVMTNAEAGALAAAGADPQAAAHTLTTEALARGSADNVSAIVVRLRPRGSSLDGAAVAAKAVSDATLLGRGPGGPKAAAAAQEAQRTAAAAVLAAAAASAAAVAAATASPGGPGGGAVRRVVPLASGDAAAGAVAAAVRALEGRD